MDFIKTKPDRDSFTWNQVHKVGSNLRKGTPYDEEILLRFLEHQAVLCDALMEIATNTVRCLIYPLNEQEGSIRPDSGDYVFAARVKTFGTLIEKLRRMPTYPLENIWDVSGLRFDCDLTLSEQIKIAELFKEDFLNAGATKVEISDMRENAHSGYRAIHLHLVTPAGRAEFQIRTAMQAQWANLYEVAADIYGRDIRYLEFGAKPNPAARTEMELLHEASGTVHQAERVADSVFIPFSSTRRVGPLHSEIRQLRSRAFGILEDRLSELVKVRSDIAQKGK
ncbi:hypothetical protein [Corynebacterium sp. KPL2838]|uniref:hypothetical protein n=1 Tax=Corynebacterium sp. KPL2838 TaxID=3158316 RepID=UPI0032EBB242